MASIPINKPFTLKPPAGTSAVLTAASVGLAVIKRASGRGAAAVTSWEQYLEESSATDTKSYQVKQNFRPSREVTRALEECPAVLGLLRTSPSVSVSECSACGGWIAVAGPTPARCTLGAGCEGKMVKAPTLSPVAP